MAFLVLPEHPATPGFLRSAGSAASPLGLDVVSMGIHDVPEIERAISGAAPEETGPATNRRGARAARERLAASADAELSPDDRRVFDDLGRPASLKVSRIS